MKINTPFSRSKHRIIFLLLFFLATQIFLVSCGPWEVSPIVEEEKPGSLDFGQSTSKLQNPSAPVSISQAKEIFTDMANDSDIAFNYPIDGCFARAYLMNKRMEEKYGVHPYKIWAFAPPGESLEVDTSGYGKVQWGYHVAPVIRVTQADGTIVDMVIDPSISSEPITVEEWKNKMNNPNAKWKVTGPGEPPYPDQGGTGYWPAPDPPNLDQYSLDLMKKYKLCGQQKVRYCE